MEQLGRLTLPTDADVVEETLRLKNLLGADALRDCDGTEMPAELLQDPAKKYATYYTTRKDNAWAEANPDEVQQEYLISDRHTARGTKLRIHLMDGFHTQQLKVNTLDDPKRWWEVIDRTTGEVVPTDKWFFDEPTGEVEIETVPYHEYTVSFLAFLIWDPVHMYNFLTNDWKDTPHQLTYDVRQPKTQAYVKEKLRRWCEANPHIDVVRFTTFFHQFTLTFDDQKREKFVEWFGYSASVSPYILEKFEKWAGYKFRPEFIVDQGYHNTMFRVPSKEFRDFIEFQQQEVCALAKEMVDIVQAEAIYQKDHPNFKLDIQENTYNDIETKLITAATSGDYSTLPDVFLMQDYSFHKYIANFPDVFTDITDSGIDFTQFTEGKLADSTADGKHYGVPFDNGATVMAVRSDMIENAGLTVDDFKDLTWSEFIPKAQKVVDANGVSMIASSGGSEMLMEMLQSAGSSPLQDGKVNVAGNAALKEAMTQYKAMVDAGIIAEYTDWDQYIASMNDGKTAGVVNGCWIMSSIQAAADQSGKWAIVNMPKLDGIDGATNYANCGGASWAVSSNCKNTELAYDFLKTTFGGSVELYDDLLPNAGAIASYLPAAKSDVYNQASDFYGGQTVYKDIVDFASKVPAYDCGAYYSDIRSALTDAITNVVQNNADIDSELETAQSTVEFSIEG